MIIELHETTPGRSVTTRVGERLRITLVENATTGYRYRIAGACSPVLKLEEDQAEAPTGPPGAAAKRVWVFAAIAQGHCELKFESARSWEKTATGNPVTFTITVQ